MRTRKKPLLRAIDLFSGCGGLTTGLKQAGFTVVGAVECDSLAVETYRMNHPRVKLFPQDIRSIKGAEILQELSLQKGELDLLAGCPPCQGFSTMRTLNGKHSVEDERNDLLFEFLRLVKELEPKAIMMENVPGLAKDTRIDEFLAGIKELGYYGEKDAVAVHNAADYGVPQRRRRMILLSGKKGRIPFASPSQKKLTVRRYLKKLPPVGKSGDPLHDLPAKHNEEVQKIIQEIPKDGGSRRNLGEDKQLPCHKKSNGFKDVYARMWWDEPAPTITGGCINPSKGRFLHPQEDRAITLREAALLQGFPKGYKFSLKRGKYPVALMIGNALPPEFIRQHSLSLIKYIQS